MRWTGSRTAAAQQSIEMLPETCAHAVKGNRVDARVDVSQTEADNLINRTMAYYSLNTIIIYDVYALQ